MPTNGGIPGKNRTFFVNLIIKSPAVGAAGIKIEVDY